MQLMSAGHVATVEGSSFIIFIVTLLLSLLPHCLDLLLILSILTIPSSCQSAFYSVFYFRFNSVVHQLKKSTG